MINEYEIVRQGAGVKLKLKRKFKVRKSDYDAGADYVPYFCRQYLYSKSDFIEKSYVVALDNNHKILGIYQVSSGDSTVCNLYARNIISFLVLIGAYDYILIHNHPWNDSCRPSDGDINSTIEISTSIERLQFHMYDHYIITSEAFYSINTCEIDDFDN